MPIYLTPVCRLWYSLLLSMPTLWSKIIINLRGSRLSKSLSMGFTDYISRTDRHGGDPKLDILLDIEIRCHPPTAGYQLEDVLSRLAAPEIDFDATANECGDSGDIIVGRQSRMERWGTLLLDLDGLGHRSSSSTVNNVNDTDANTTNHYANKIDDIFKVSNRKVFITLENVAYNAPRLSQLTVQNVHFLFKAHSKFAPNLNKLILKNINSGWESDFSKLKSLSITGSWDPWDHRRHIWPGASTIEELSVSMPIAAASSHYELSVEFPKLKRLEIHHTISRNLLDCLNAQFERDGGDMPNGRRLESLRLIEIQPSVLLLLKQNFIMRNAKQIILHNTPFVSSLSQNDYTRFLGGGRARELAEFLATCALDCKVIAMDAESMEALQAAQKEMNEMTLLRERPPSPSAPIFNTINAWRMSITNEENGALYID